MRHTPERHTDAADRTVKDIRRKTRKRYSSEDKIRPVGSKHLGNSRQRTLLNGDEFGENVRKREFCYLTDLVIECR